MAAVCPLPSTVQKLSQNFCDAIVDLVASIALLCGDNPIRT